MGFAIPRQAPSAALPDETASGSVVGSLNFSKIRRARRPRPSDSKAAASRNATHRKSPATPWRSTRSRKAATSMSLARVGMKPISTTAAPIPGDRGVMALTRLGPGLGMEGECFKAERTLLGQIKRPPPSRGKFVVISPGNGPESHQLVGVGSQMGGVSRRSQRSFCFAGAECGA